MQLIPRVSYFKLLSLALLAFITNVSACKKQPSLNLDNAGQLVQPEERKEIDAAGLIRMAQRMEAAGDYANAMTFYADALTRDSSLLEAYLGVARLLKQIGQNAQSTLYYGRALAVAPDDTATLQNYVIGLINLDRPADAVSVIEKYLNSYETTAGIQNLLGVAYDLQSNHAVAQNAYRTGIAFVSASDDIYVHLVNNLALSLAISDQYSEAVLLLNPLVGDIRQGLKNMTPQQSLYRQNLALVYAISGQTQAAVDVAKSALSKQEAEFNRHFYETVSTLSGYERTRAVFLKKLPESNS